METLNIYIIYIRIELKERIYEYVPMGENIHILSHEQAVCGRGTKIGKKLT